MLMGTGGLLESFLFTVLDVLKVAYSTASMFQDTLFTGLGSLTSGKSFLLPQCRTDVLYVSDPCEHLDQGEEGDIGFFRGIFKSFATSKVRKMLIKREAQLHPTEVCPYCKAKLWSMLQAKMVPESASCRLGAYEDAIEYYVCLNGHVLGICTLLPLSDSEEASDHSDA